MNKAKGEVYYKKVSLNRMSQFSDDLSRIGNIFFNNRRQPISGKDIEAWRRIKDIIFILKRNSDELERIKKLEECE